MELSKMVAVVAVVALALLASSPRAALGQSCDTSKFTNLQACLPAATGSGSVTSSCCSAMMAYRSNPSCLCSTLVYAKSQLSSINLNNALAIPKACGYSSYIPSGFTCQGITVPR
ncbi:hypothetical protein SELMODRAFT_441550 [Selaginella moellendorffii]|uniref:Bifunctional inhibitor/plant lipid transfer protein/seed storage helical domain-containing protein n=1 Tax=Selaginella moellendorffii TaxID=88036 RepID=D8RKL1_SELML|nr:non-specific lipid-transfer protein 3 [Selaginella moellendorffii]XP_002991586.1 non-specific lipid-transfer protein 3 [Selaginella moellendorffii]EFJ07340.1 hypothetical protein SELMODRAFT_448492 [Selaginella moellendorffii]EFJ27461.1 hypothetical protein SELMODRAFT_441550 [Selaginella moellendorffii]|eukprot:XP_002971712.1 non-specific lipid-transfer protein 3 [Selaginella moellendorffii]